MIATGGMAPDFELPLTDPARPDNAEPLRLSSLRGSWVVLYFYPRDSTPSCTLEGQEFSALVPEFSRRGARIVGISTDSPRRHANFCRKAGLSVPLLSDEAGDVSRLFGTWAEKTMAGRKYFGIVRSTFLIDPQGRIARLWSPVRSPGHAAEVLARLDDELAG